MTKHFDAEAVRAFEHAGWQRAASAYTSTFAHATSAFIDDLLDAGRVEPRTRVLDVACGPGLVAAAAAARGAMPTGLDFSSAMIGVARAAYPEIRFELGDAEAMPFASGSFDVVVSNFGIHHVPDPVKALTEAWRVLRPDGLIAITTWAAPRENTAWRILFDAISAHGDLDAAAAPPSGGSLRSCDDVLRILDAAGFAEVAATRATAAWRFASATDLLAGFRRGTVRMAALIDAQAAAALPRIEAAIEQNLVAYQPPGGFAVPIVAILGSARRA